MKTQLFISLSIFICSCHDISQTGAQAKAGFGTWMIRDSTVQFHSYTKTGLLDSTFKVLYYFRDGELNLRLSTLISREYDSAGNLKAAKTFNYSDKTNKWNLTGKNIKKYDLKGNMVLDVEVDTRKSKNIVSSQNTKIYNLKNQKIIQF